MNSATKKMDSELKKVSFDRFRLTVFRSKRNISAQIVDDINNKTSFMSNILKIELLEF